MLFRSKKAKKSTPAESLEAFRRGLNDLVDAAERNRVGLGEFATVLSQTSETLKYRNRSRLGLFVSHVHAD